VISTTQQGTTGLSFIVPVGFPPGVRLSDRRTHIGAEWRETHSSAADFRAGKCSFAELGLVGAGDADVWLLSNLIIRRGAIQGCNKGLNSTLNIRGGNGPGFAARHR
jgi:hypothetical protein